MPDKNLLADFEHVETERNRFEFLKEQKRLRDELLWERRREAMPGLEIPTKTQPPKRPRKQNPLPGDFKEALSELDSSAGEYLNALSKADRPSLRENLRKLYGTGANPSFILSLLMYLWNEDIDAREHKGATVQHWQKSLAAIREIKNTYRQFITKVPGLETFADADNFELALLGIEENIGHFLNGKDFREPEPGKNRSPEDKTNRVIFTICEYVKQKTGRRQWQTVLDLLVAAGAIRMGIKKLRKHYRIPDNPDRRIATRLRAFQKDHPKEACYIKEHILDLARLSSS
jgi:hypothetical protein